MILREKWGNIPFKIFFLEIMKNISHFYKTIIKHPQEMYIYVLKYPPIEHNSWKME